MRGQQRQRALGIRAKNAGPENQSAPRPWGEVEGDMRGVIG